MHINTLVFDFSRVLLFPTQLTYQGELNALHHKLSSKPDYVLNKHFYLNTQLLEYLQTLTEYPKHIYTSGHIQELPELQIHLSPIFTSTYTSSDIGPKNSPESYLHLIKLLDHPPNRVLFIDDSSDNIDAAKIAGLNTHLFITNDLLLSALAHLPNTKNPSST